MIKENVEIDVAKLVNDFYSKPFYLSYSGLNKILYSPTLFYRHYILQQKEEKLESYLIDGKVIHSLILGNFDDLFILMPTTLPTGNTRIVVDKIYDRVKEGPGLLENYSIEIIEILKEINLHQSLTDDKKAPNKTGDQKRLEKILTDDAKSYFEFLKIKGDKDLIDSDTLNRCSEAVMVIRDDKISADLLGLFTNEMDNVDIYNEILLFTETDKAFGLKGIIDNIKIDHDKKIIFINDIKTTSKTISDFQETVEFYNYWAQAAIYERLVRYNFLIVNEPDWKIIFTFVVIDKYNQVYPFEVSQDTIQKWQLKLEDNLNEASWHYTQKNYSLPYKFASGKVIL